MADANNRPKASTVIPETAPAPMAVPPLCSSSESWLPPGTVLGEYQIQAPIGQGGMGQVYRAWHARMHRAVAFKVLTGPSPASPQALLRFEREIQASAQMSHANLVRAYHAGEYGGILFLVMELIDGQSLHGRVRANGPMTPAAALAVILQAAQGLAHVHDQGLVHRDIKPSNVMIDAGGTVKILDLGLAGWRSRRPTDDEPLTGPGQLMGTVDYMAPEQAGQAAEVDRRADIYSLGCTLYFLLTGQPPFPVGSVAERLIAHRTAPPPRLPAGCPSALDAVLARMLAKSPEDRFASMHEVIAALQRATTGEASTRSETDSTTTPTNAPSGPRRALPKMSRLIAAALIILATALAWPVAVWLRGNRENDASHRLPDPSGTPDAAYAAFPPGTTFDQQVAWLLPELAKLNPGFDPTKANSHIDDGNPHLHLEDQPGLADIRPLARMRSLSCLTLRGAQVDNLTPLTELRLRLLDCSSTLVTDLTPLRSMPLLRELIISNTRVKDLRPLEGTLLRVLDCHNTPVDDLTPLAEMPLEDLNCCDTLVEDLTPLPRTVIYLGIERTRAKNLGPLKALPLQQIWCDEPAARAHPFLRDMTQLRMINGIPVQEFWKNR